MFDSTARFTAFEIAFFKKTKQRTKGGFETRYIGTCFRLFRLLISEGGEDFQWK